MNNFDTKIEARILSDEWDKKIANLVINRINSNNKESEKIFPLFLNHPVLSFSSIILFILIIILILAIFNQHDIELAEEILFSRIANISFLY
jgi:hypothetical protein